MLERHNDMWQMGAQYKTEQTLAAHRKEHVDGQAFGVAERKSNSEIAGKIPTRATEEENKTNQTFSHSQRSRHACVQKNLPPGGAGQPAQIARPSPATASWMVEQKKATKKPKSSHAFFGWQIWQILLDIGMADSFEKFMSKGAANQKKTW